MSIFRSRPPREIKAPQRETGLLAAITLGIVAGSPSPLYLASLNSVAKGNPSVAGGVASVLLLAAIVQLMAEVPIVLYIVAPDRCDAVLATANAWLARRGQVIVLTAAGIVGWYFVASGVADLLL